MLRVSRNRVGLDASIKQKLGAQTSIAVGFFRPGAGQERFIVNQAILDETWTALNELFWSTCAFCESESPDLLVGHFRPPCDATDLDGKASPEHYWWLSYEWENLYLICPTCNFNKGNRFPVNGTRMRVGAKGEQAKLESRYLIDPCNDEPSNYLNFLDDGTVESTYPVLFPDMDRGQVTIDTLGLNRTELVSARRDAVATVRKRLEKLEAIARVRGGSLGVALEQLADELDERDSYVAAKRQYAARQLCLKESLRSLLAENEAAADELQFLETEIRIQKQLLEGRPETTTKAAITGKGKIVANFDNSYIQRLQIRNFRAIGDLDLSFSENTPLPIDQTNAEVEALLSGETDHRPAPVRQRAGWKVLIGENGAGKSSILKAIAMALMGESYYRRVASEFGLTPESIFNNKTKDKDGLIRVELTKGETIEIVLSRNQEPRFVSGQSGGANMYFRAYGAARLYSRRRASGDGSSEELTKESENLFQPELYLRHPEFFLEGLSGHEFDSAALSLRDLLSIPVSVRRPLKKKTASGSTSILLDSGGGYLPFSEQSDGYMSVIALFVDILSGLQKSLHDKSNSSGIVIVDEIDSHLHPRWKMTIVESLRRTFPMIQFICTTHDPLCLRRLGPGEIARLRRDKGITTVQDSLPATTGLRVDQLLTSEHFGLDSTIDPDIDLKFHLYYRLLGATVDTDLQSRKEALLQRMSAELQGHNTLGFTRRDRIVYGLVDEFLARQKASGAGSAEIDEQLRAKVFEVWDSVGAYRGNPK